MAYVSLIAILVVTVILMFGIELERIKALETVITWLYMTLGSVIGFYMGSSTWSQVTYNRTGK